MGLGTAWSACPLCAVEPDIRQFGVNPVGLRNASPGTSGYRSSRGHTGAKCLSLEKRANLPAQLVLNVIDRTPRIHDAEMEFLGHRRVLAEQAALIRAKAVVDVITELQVHARFPELHS